MKRMLILISLILVTFSGLAMAWDHEIGYYDTTGQGFAYNSFIGSFSVPGNDSCIMWLHGISIRTVGANEVLDSAFIFSWQGTGSLDIAVFDLGASDTTMVTGSLKTITPGSNTTKFWGAKYSPQIGLTTGHTYTIAIGNEPIGMSTGFASADSGGANFGKSENTSRIPPATWHSFGATSIKFAAYVTIVTGTGCTTPTNTLTFIDSTTTTVKIQNVIAGGNTTKDSTQYFDNGVYFATLLKADSATQRIIRSSLALGSTHYLKAISWDSTCVSSYDSILTKTLAAPLPLVSCQIDSIPGHADLAYFVYVTPSQSTDDTIYIRVSTGVCGDSGTVTLRKQFANNTTDSIEYTTTGTPTFTSYVSGWVKENTHGISARCCASRIFDVGVPTPEALISCAIDSIANRSDSAWFVYTTSSQAGNVYVRAWIDTVYHDSSSAYTVQKAYVANKTDSIKVKLPWVVTFSARASGYVHNSVSGYGPRSQANRTFHAAGAEAGNCDTGLLESEMNSIENRVVSLQYAAIKAQDSLDGLSAGIAYLRTHGTTIDSADIAKGAKGAIASTPVVLPDTTSKGDTLITSANATYFPQSYVDSLLNALADAGRLKVQVQQLRDSTLAALSDAGKIKMQLQAARDSINQLRAGTFAALFYHKVALAADSGSGISQSFPPNFASMKISSGGYVSPNFADVNGQIGVGSFLDSWWHNQALRADSGSVGSLTADLSPVTAKIDSLRIALGVMPGYTTIISRDRTIDHILVMNNARTDTVYDQYYRHGTRQIVVIPPDSIGFQEK